MKFAKIVYWAAGIWGVLVLTPLFFIFDSIGHNDPPPVTHPGFYYGFATVGLAFQLLTFVQPPWIVGVLIVAGLALMFERARYA